MRLENKVCVVTGAAGALGSATAAVMAREGAFLVLADRDGDALGAAVADLPTDRVRRVVCDVATPEGNAAIVQAATEAWGRVDVFFGNAGIEGVGTFMGGYPEDTYDAVMQVNVKALFLGLQAVVPAMAKGGSIILTSSIAGLAGMPQNIAYTAAKHAVVGLMRSSAKELGSRGIRANTIHPGYVETPMLRRLISQRPDPAAAEAAMLAQVKLGAFVTPQDIANAVLFLASDESRMVNAQTLVIDGGTIQ